MFRGFYALLSVNNEYENFINSFHMSMWCDWIFVGVHMKKYLTYSCALMWIQWMGNSMFYSLCVLVMIVVTLWFHNLYGKLETILITDYSIGLNSTKSFPQILFFMSATGGGRWYICERTINKLASFVSKQWDPLRVKLSRALLY